MNTEHEGESLPSGYFEFFREAIRSEGVFSFVAEVDSVVIGGGASRFTSLDLRRPSGGEPLCTRNPHGVSECPASISADSGCR